MLIKTYGAALEGIDAALITIEVSSQPGCDFVLVGLPDNAVRESRERVASAMIVSGYQQPRCSLVINMSPADIKKEGAAYDLPLCVGMLAATEQVSTSHLGEYIIMGELSLDGSLLPVKGALSMALMARDKGYKGIILPNANAQEAAIVDNIEVIGASSLREVMLFLDDMQPIEPAHVDVMQLFADAEQHCELDFSDVRGQENVKRAIEVAAAGGHNLMMVGPPGAGKSMMAKRISSILPPLTLEEALETTKIHSVAGLIARGASIITQRPFRSPHHTVTDVALVGGGSNPQPGEVSLAHHGVLFLDELPEYKRSALEVLRQPLEDRHIAVARAKMRVDFPASFMLVAAMNPCKCGHYNDPNHPCTCTPGEVHKYLNRISGPLLDRIDIQCEITPISFDDLQSREPAEHSSNIRERVLRARAIQSARFAGTGTYCNAQMTTKQQREYCQLDDACLTTLRFAMDKLGLSARAYDRILKVARTIADLDGKEQIAVQHIAEAISYRNLDRNTWGE